MTIVSTLIAQKSPSPTELGEERKVVLDVFGGGAGRHGVRGSGWMVSSRCAQLRSEQGHAEQQHRDHEACEEHHENDFPVGHQHQPELEDDHEDLARLGAEQRGHGAARGRRIRDPQHHRVDHDGGDVDDASQHRRQRPVRPLPQPGDDRYHDRRGRLPSKDAADRFGREGRFHHRAGQIAPGNAANLSILTALTPWLATKCCGAMPHDRSIGAAVSLRTARRRS